MAFGVTGFFCPFVPDAFLYYAIAIKSFFGILHNFSCNPYGSMV